MALLSNQGDIIIDTVLTVEGRRRLANGTFNIVKFSCMDDEIAYNLFNKSHSSGSAYFDLQILQMPVFQAACDTSTAHSHLITIPRTNLLYLPVIMIAERAGGATRMNTLGSFFVATDDTTETAYANNIDGLLYGENPKNSGNHVRLDQGLNTTEIPASFNLQPDLVETQYVIEIDNRFGYICDKEANRAKVSYIDEDSIATYILTLNTDKNFVKENPDKDVNSKSQVIAGPRGTLLEFKIQSSVDLNSSTYLFTQLGSTMTFEGISVQYIDSTVRVTGGTTGYRLDVPVRFIKKA
jgi:hypothetical protein